MAEIREFTPQKLIVPMLIAPTAPLCDVLAEISSALGEISFLSAPIPFDFTDYYEPEMGSDLVRRFVTVRRLVDPSRLWEFKHATDRVERCFLGSPAGPGRSINLDPGVLSLSRLILASTKDFSHRVPLRDGIYAEVTLLYSKGRFQALPWTFPDYRSKAYHRVLACVRDLYHAQLRAQTKSAAEDLR